MNIFEILEEELGSKISIYENDKPKTIYLDDEQEEHLCFGNDKGKWYLYIEPEEGEYMREKGAFKNYPHTFGFDGEFFDEVLNGYECAINTKFYGNNYNIPDEYLNQWEEFKKSKLVKS